MRHLLSGIAIIAALAVAAPAWAQRTGPGPGAQTGSGPGVTPPGGFGPSSSLFNLPEGFPTLPGAAPSWTVPASAKPYVPPATTPSGLPPRSP
jgi:hypothetical protein